MCVLQELWNKEYKTLAKGKISFTEALIHEYVFQGERWVLQEGGNAWAEPGEQQSISQVYSESPSSCEMLWTQKDQRSQTT